MSLFEKKEPQPVEVKGEPLTCPVCKNTLFWTRNTLLSTPLSVFVPLDWANRQATCFVCSECTYIFWFLGR